jgi:hypothetical protein
MNSFRGEFFRAPDVIHIIRIAAINEGVARFPITRGKSHQGLSLSGFVGKGGLVCFLAFQFSSVSLFSRLSI